MTKFTKDGKGYHIAGKTYEMLEGSRAQVWHGTAYKTSGELTKKDLLKNKSGRIVSSKKHATAKREMRLKKYGYGTKKGKFGFVKIGKSMGRKMGKGKGKGSHKRRGKRGGSHGDVMPSMQDNLKPTLASNASEVSY
jgi:hypothetical protein